MYREQSTVNGIIEPFDNSSTETTVYCKEPRPLSFVYSTCTVYERRGLTYTTRPAPEPCTVCVPHKSHVFDVAVLAEARRLDRDRTR